MCSMSFWHYRIHEKKNILYIYNYKFITIIIRPTSSHNCLSIRCLLGVNLDLYWLTNQTVSIRSTGGFPHYLSRVSILAYHCLQAHTGQQPISYSGLTLQVLQPTNLTHINGLSCILCFLIHFYEVFIHDKFVTGIHNCLYDYLSLIDLLLYFWVVYNISRISHQLCHIMTKLMQYTKNVIKNLCAIKKIGKIGLSIYNRHHQSCLCKNRHNRRCHFKNRHRQNFRC